jgi:MFS family permease
MGRAWLVVATCFLMLVMGAGPVYYAYGNYAVAFAQEFGASRSIINLGFTLVGIVGNLGAAPVGMLADRLPVRWLVAFGIIGTALGFALISLAQGIWPIVILFGTLVAMADICIGVVMTNYIIAHWFGRRRGLALGLSLIGTSVAGVVFPPLTDLLIGAVGWRSTFLIYAATMLAVLPLIWSFAGLPAAMPEPERMAPEPGVPEAAMPLRALLSMPAFWIISIGCGAVTGASTGLMVSLVSFAKARGLSTAEGSYLISLLAISAMCGKAVFGFVIDRIGFKRALQGGIGCGITGCLILASAGSYAQMLAACVIFGLALGAIMPVWGAALAATVGLASFGRALGWSRVMWAPISMIFPLIAGGVYDRTGDYGIAWLLFAAILGAALGSTLLWRTKPDQITPSSASPSSAA